MNIQQLNHVAIHVDDVEKSRQFYGDVLGLEEIQRPAFDFPGAWFRIGVDQELHLIGRPPSPEEAGRVWHYAMRIDSVEEMVDALREKSVSFTPPTKRPDGAWQIFLRDPDGHLIELCSPPQT